MVDHLVVQAVCKVFQPSAAREQADLLTNCFRETDGELGERLREWLERRLTFCPSEKHVAHRVSQRHTLSHCKQATTVPRTSFELICGVCVNFEIL